MSIWTGANRRLGIVPMPIHDHHRSSWFLTTFGAQLVHLQIPGRPFIPTIDIWLLGTDSWINLRSLFDPAPPIANGSRIMAVIYSPAESWPIINRSINASTMQWIILPFLLIMEKWQIFVVVFLWRSGSRPILRLGDAGLRWTRRSTLSDIFRAKSRYWLRDKETFCRFSEAS